jgi:hypothetical protein
MLRIEHYALTRIAAKWPEFSAISKEADGNHGKVRLRRIVLKN